MIISQDGISLADGQEESTETPVWRNMNGFQFGKTSEWISEKVLVLGIELSKVTLRCLNVEEICLEGHES